MTTDNSVNYDINMLAQLAMAIAHSNNPTADKSHLLAAAVARLLGAIVKLSVIGGAQDPSALHTTLDMTWDSLRIQSGNAPGGSS